MEAEALLRGLGLVHDGLGRERRLAADAAPLVGGIVVVKVREVCLLAIAHVEEIGKEADVLADLAVTEQRRNGHLHVLGEQVE